MKSSYLITLFASASLFFGPAASVAVAKTLKVKCNNGQTIQHRLDNNAKVGDTITVSGTCNENVVVRVDGVRLEADEELGAEIVAADIDANTVTIVANRVRIIGFAAITGGRIGIVISRSGSAIIEDNTINANGFDSIGDKVSRGHGIFVGRSSTADISGNTIDGNGDTGVRVADASSARIDDNKIMNHSSGTNIEGAGISVRQNSSVRLSDQGGPNELTNNRWGWRCRFNSFIWPTESQTHSGNTTDFSIDTGCVRQGLLF